MSLIERAMAKREPNAPPPAVPQQTPTLEATTVVNGGAKSEVTDSKQAKSISGTSSNSGASGANGTNGAKGANGTNAAIAHPVAKKIDGAVAKTSAPVTKRKRIKLKLRTIGAQDYVREGPNRSELLGTFRHIKRPLLANVYGHGVPATKQGRRIMVTSALPGEGKTFTSIHLALSIAAEVETSVILVDGDIIRPSVHTVLGIDQQRGIADWFNDNKTPFAKIVSSTNVDGLKIVTAGQWKPNSAEALASRSMAQFFDALAAEYPDAILVVDSPPLLPASESATLAKSMGQVVLVVGAGVTSQSQVNQALEMLEGEQAISLVLNRSRNSSSYANYGY